MMEALGSFKYTRDTMEALEKEARKEAEQFGPNPIMHDALDKLLLSWKKD
jgi:hypothetical protein